MINVYDALGNLIDISKIGLRCTSFIPESLSPQFVEESREGVDGSILLGTTAATRKLYTKFLIEAIDHLDYQLLRDEIYKIYDPRKDRFIVDTRQPGKRWRARTSSAFRPEYINFSTGQFDLEFSVAFPYAESIGTSLDPFTFDSELWQMGQGLPADIDLFYKHSTTTFSIYNAGDIDLDPRWLPLIISYKGASTNLKIKNTTTNVEWAYTGTSNVGDSINLDGIRSTKNGLSITRATNKKLLTLAPGWNNFILTGTSGSFEITFDFRFYYL
ncbi:MULTISPECIES: phage tail family protein [unclassified Bacillus (in: firmicutes)]|uniref:phage tail family protein n=1 Tax=unclassified Bacillus (in: firmicutes) TaxID=185979 RepID=UPI001BEA4664|nr:MULTISPECIES: phage tail family protein [unclassified Bacillus (in: firmicutes)]MBT2614121.1 phage tail family protein [Bacillus sp. ISL-78]MBT2629368.1 phage tail family protein [Bacillus sp. ISL-101]